MRAATIAIVLVIMSALTASAQTQKQAQTARDYFAEIQAANALTSFSDKYVCFRDDEVPSFWVVSSSEDMIAEMTGIGDTKGAKTIAAAGPGLAVRTFYKGVETGSTTFFPKVGGGYQMDSDAQYHLRTVYRINWATGRFSMQIFDTVKSKVLPAYTVFGKCELVHAGDSASVLGRK